MASPSRSGFGQQPPPPPPGYPPQQGGYPPPPPPTYSATGTMAPGGMPPPPPPGGNFGGAATQLTPEQKHEKQAKLYVMIDTCMSGFGVFTWFVTLLWFQYGFGVPGLGPSGLPKTVQYLLPGLLIVMISVGLGCVFLFVKMDKKDMMAIIWMIWTGIKAFSELLIIVVYTADVAARIGELLPGKYWGLVIWLWIVVLADDVCSGVCIFNIYKYYKYLKNPTAEPAQPGAPQPMAPPPVMMG